LQIDGSAAKEDVFAQIDKALSNLVEERAAAGSVAA